jgi:hypothetical protein
MKQGVFVWAAVMVVVAAFLVPPMMAEVEGRGLDPIYLTTVLPADGGYAVFGNRNEHVIMFRIVGYALYDNELVPFVADGLHVESAYYWQEDHGRNYLGVTHNPTAYDDYTAVQYVNAVQNNIEGGRSAD